MFIILTIFLLTGCKEKIYEDLTDENIILQNNILEVYSDYNLSDIINEITVDVKREDILNPNDSKISGSGAQQGFFVSNGLKYNGAGKTEARVSTVNENGKVYIYLDWHNENNKYEVTENGLYTYRWRWYVADSKVNLVVSIIKDGKRMKVI